MRVSGEASARNSHSHWICYVVVAGQCEPQPQPPDVSQHNRRTHLWRVRLVALQLGVLGPAVGVQGERVRLVAGAADGRAQLAGGERLDGGEGQDVEQPVARGRQLLLDGGAVWDRGGIWLDVESSKSLHDSYACMVVMLTAAVSRRRPARSPGGWPPSPPRRRRRGPARTPCSARPCHPCPPPPVCVRVYAWMWGVRWVRIKEDTMRLSNSKTHPQREGQPPVVDAPVLHPLLRRHQHARQPPVCETNVRLFRVAEALTSVRTGASRGRARAGPPAQVPGPPPTTRRRAALLLGLLFGGLEWGSDGAAASNITSDSMLNIQRYTCVP